MNTILWAFAITVAIAMCASGTMKLVRPKAALESGGMAWAEDFPSGAIKALGGAEVLGAAGLILPAVLDKAVVLVPIAATCIAVVMVGAIGVHLRRCEGLVAVLPAALTLILAIIVAWGRFGPYAF
jgi:DoxX-like family